MKSAGAVADVAGAAGVLKEKSPTARIVHRRRTVNFNRRQSNTPLMKRATRVCSPTQSSPMRRHRRNGP